MAGFGKQMVFDHLAYGGQLIGQRTFVEFVEDGFIRSRQQIGRHFVTALRNAGVVEFAADEREERWFDLGIRQLCTTGDKTHDGFSHFLRNEFSTWLHHRGQCLNAGHASQPHAVLRDAGHRCLQALQVRQVVFAQRDQHAVVAACEVEGFCRTVVCFQSLHQRLRRPVLDQVGQFLDELGCTLAPEVVALGQGEDLLELVEDQQRNQRAPIGVVQHIVAVVQEFPQRLALDRHTGLRP